MVVVVVVVEVEVVLVAEVVAVVSRIYLNISSFSGLF